MYTVQKLKPLRLGTSSDLLVGQRVFAIGNPFGLDHTYASATLMFFLYPSFDADTPHTRA